MPWESREFAALHVLAMETVYVKCGRYALRLPFNYSYKLNKQMQTSHQIQTIPGQYMQIV